jgi:SAM-dependent methyltransferase
VAFDGFSTSGPEWSRSFASAGVDAMEIYDRVLVPRMFEPWARLLLDELRVASGENVLDVACGPGTVARLAAQRVGVAGRVSACDLSPAMLAIAAAKPEMADAAPVEYREASADGLDVVGGAYDVVTCQQGLQFFGNRRAAIDGMRRALRVGGRVGIAVWCAIESCPPFAALGDAIAVVFGDQLASGYRNGPWGFGDPGELHRLLDDAGFVDVNVAPHRLAVEFEGGAPQLLSTLAAASIAHEIEAADDNQRAELAREVDAAVRGLTQDDGVIRSHLTANIATATC